jgi:DNA-binding SARP family transcriptional activator/tetratricopeptide (TPR) repeat protein
VEFRLLGEVEAVRDGRRLDLGRRRERCLLGLLLLDVGKVIPVDRLLDLLWDGDPPQTALKQLRVNVSRIRRRLGTDGTDDTGDTGLRILTRGSGYVALTGLDNIDVHRFRHGLERAQKLIDPAERVAVLGPILALWRGPALADVATSLLRERVTANLDELHLTAVELHLEAQLACGQHREVISELVDLVTRHPLRQRLVGLLMLALYRDRRQPEALDTYHRLSTRLADELGLDPDPQTRRLHEAILRADQALDLGHDSDPPTGLRPATQDTQTAAPDGRAHAKNGAAPNGRPAAPQREPRWVRPAQLPLDVYGFTGRGGEIARLDAILAAAGEQPTAVIISALSGTAGVGKTALAVHWAHRVAGRFPDGQLYVNLRGFDPGGSLMSPADAIRGFLDALEVSPQRIPTGLAAQVGLYRSLLANRRVLIVLDNARDAEQVRPLLPGAPGCLVVVTSRNQLSGLVVAESAHPLTVDLLSTAEAHDLLTRRLGRARVAAEPYTVDDIIGRCARLPLALSIVASRAAAHPGFPLARLADELRHTREGLNAFAGDDATTDLRAVFSWSYHTLSAGAARLFRLLGLHPGPDLTLRAAASLAGVPVRQVRLLLAELTRAHLVTEHVPGRYTFHDLLRTYATELAHGLDTDAERRAALHRMLDHYLHTAHTADRLVDAHRSPITLTPPQPGVTPDELDGFAQAMAWFAVEHPVLLAAVALAADAGFDAHAWKLTWTMSTFLDRAGHWQDWAQTHRIALEAARRLDDPAWQAHAHRFLGRALATLGRHDEAYPQFRHAIDLYLICGDQLGETQAHRNLSWAYGLGGDQEQSLRLGQRALELARAIGHRTEQAHALNTVGWCHAQLGNYREALADCKQALALHHEAHDPVGEAAAWDSLGFVHHHLGHYRQAAACYRHACELRRETGEPYNEARTLCRLGDTYQAAGEAGPARDAWQRALDIFDELGVSEATEVRGKLRYLLPQ